MCVGNRIWKTMGNKLDEAKVCTHRNWRTNKIMKKKLVNRSYVRLYSNDMQDTVVNIRLYHTRWLSSLSHSHLNTLTDGSVMNIQTFICSNSTLKGQT